jgi:hypothetical protein
MSFFTKTFLLIELSILLLSTSLSQAKTLQLTGRISGEVAISEQMTFGVARELSLLSYRFPIPVSQKSSGISQKLLKIDVQADPRPATQKEETDAFGNRFKVLTWERLRNDARLTVSYTVDIEADLTSLSSSAPFPVQAAPAEQVHYLKATRLVQSDNSDIEQKSRKLTAGAVSQAAAVEAILNFVSDHISYETPPASYDALFSLTSRNGNCQNFAHLSAALLRSAGIPARVAVGLALKEKWKVPSGKNSFIVQGMGEGLHAWLEVWFPDLGWLPCDPQQSRQFTSTRHIKFSHGAECTDLGNSWSGSPELPTYSSVLSSNFIRDEIDLHLSGTGNDPRGYIASHQIKTVVAKAAPEVILPVTPPKPKPVPILPPKPEHASKPKPKPKAVEKPKPVPIQPPKPLHVPEIVPPDPIAHPVPKPEPVELAKPLPVPQPKPKPAEPPRKTDKGGTVVFGNQRLPEKLAFYTESGNKGEATLERETAEYVTAPGSVYAQAFTVERPMRLNSVALGMKKFGGDGTVYLDIVADENNKPGLTSGIRTLPISLETIKRTPGYGWLEFPVPADAEPFAAGKYWIVLRRSGDAIMNWYFTPGKPYGGPDDTRSTARGWQWEDILMFDFVFKVTATAR